MVDPAEGEYVQRYSGCSTTLGCGGLLCGGILLFVVILVCLGFWLFCFCVDFLVVPLIGGGEVGGDSGDETAEGAFSQAAEVGAGLLS